MNLEEMRQKTINELNESLKNKRKELLEIAENILQKKEKNVKKARFVRKEIARIKTVINQKKILGDK